jgi:hypothetical protein
MSINIIDKNGLQTKKDLTTNPAVGYKITKSIDILE